MQAYRLGEDFRYQNYAPDYGFVPGMTVYTDDDLTDTDSEGEVRIYSTPEGGRSPSGDVCGYAVPSALIPLARAKPGEVVQISAVRAALVALGIEADVVAVAQAIEAAVS
jgi:hypothetical protein